MTNLEKEVFEDESEKKFISSLIIKVIVSEMPELALKRRELSKKRLRIIDQIREAKKHKDKNKLIELYVLHDNLGKEINKIDKLIEEGFILQSQI